MPVGGMHMMAAGLAAAVAKAGVDDPVRRAPSARSRAPPTAGSPASWLEGGRARRGRRRRVQRRPAGRLPRAARRPATRRGRPARHVLAVVPCCGSPACGACRRRTPPTTTSTSVRDWDGSFRALIHDGRADARPVDPRHAAQPRRPQRWRPPDCSTPLRARTDAQPRRPDRLGAASAAGSSTTCGAQVESLGYPDRRRRRARCTTRPTGRRMGMEHGTPFALAHTFFQTGPFRPNNVNRKAPGLVFTGSSTRARRRRADGARVGQAGRAARRRVRRARRGRDGPGSASTAAPTPTTQLLPTGP